MGRPKSNEKSVTCEIVTRASQIAAKGYTVAELERQMAIAEGHFKDNGETEWFIRKEAYRKVIEASKAKEAKGEEHAEA